MRLSRRSFLLRGLAGMGAAGLLAACGGQTTAPTATPEPMAPTPTPTSATPTPGMAGTTPAPTAEPTPEARSAWDAVVDQAKQEGRLVLYDGHGGALPTIAFAAQEFQRDFGIRVDVSVMRASEAQEKIRVEQQSGQPVADAQTVGAGNVWDETRLGILQPIGELPNAQRVMPEVIDAVKPYGQDFLDFAVWEAIQIYGILVNTQLVPEGSEPKSWQDITDPRFRGQLIMDDPRATGGGNFFFVVSLKNFGQSFHEAVVQQQPVLTRNIAEAANRVARGEFALMVPFALGLYAQIKDLPTVKIVIPEEGAMYALHGLVIPKRVNNPNAARLFADYLLSDKVQRHLAQNFVRPVVPGALEAAPPEAQRLLESKLWGTHDDMPRRQELLQLAQSIYDL